MSINEILRRANLNSIEEYLISGFEVMSPPEPGTMNERLQEAYEQIDSIVGVLCKDGGKSDEINERLDHLIFVCREAYFELGLIVGAKIAYQVRNKIIG